MKPWFLDKISAKPWPKNKNKKEKPSKFMHDTVLWGSGPEGIWMLKFHVINNRFIWKIWAKTASKMDQKSIAKFHWDIWTIKFNEGT